MRRVPVLLCTALALASAVPTALAAQARAASARTAPAAAIPVAGHHQVVFSPAAAAFMSSATATMHPVSAQDLIPQLDAAGIERAAVLSVAWVYGQPVRSLDGEYRRVRAENDWAARQAAEYPDRLVALCSVDPLKDYALAELARCAASPEFGRGIKLQPAAGGVRFDDAAQVEQMRRVFRSANARGMAIVLQLGGGTDAAQARLLIEQLLPQAPDVEVQVAYSRVAEPDGAEGAPQLAALGVLADAAARQDPRMRQVWLD
ncbi:MAG: amidohydrolase family protein, partial [Telluria sp.]